MEYVKYIPKKRLILFYFYRIRKFLFSYKNLLIYLFKEIMFKNKNDGFLFYGLQRSGTNILKKIMQDNGTLINNPDEYPANSNINRHFRFRSECVPVSSLADYFPKPEVLFDSSTMPQCFIDNRIKYIVSVRDFDEWILSIVTWGDKHRWFDGYNTKINSLNYFAIDYIKYCQHWINLANNPSINIKIFPFSSKSIKADVKNFLNMDINMEYYENKTYRGSKDFHNQKNIKSIDNKNNILDSVDDDLRKQAKKLFNVIKFDLTK